MRLIVLMSLVAFAAGCGGVGQKELDMLEQRLGNEIQASATRVKGELTDVARELPKVVAAANKVESALKDFRELRKAVESSQGDMDAKVKGARKDMLAIVEAEEKLLVDRLTSLRDVIQTLRESQGGTVK